MKSKLLYGLLFLVLVALPVLAGYNKAESTTTLTPTSTATTADNWWKDKWGEPEYGGTLTYHVLDLEETYWDGLNPAGIMLQFGQESLFCNSMTTDRNEHAFITPHAPIEYRDGWLAKSWELADPTTVTVHLRQDVYWQDKEPVNGRKLTAYDVEYTYDRLKGTGSGFTKPYMFYPPLKTAVEEVNAIDDYTVQFKIHGLYDLALYDIMGPVLGFGIVAREWIDLGEEGQKDWHNAVGTGAFMLTDFIAGSSLTYRKNPDYWGVDERYGKQLPYLDTLRVLCIGNMPTALAAMRTGKLDIIANDRGFLSLQQAQSLAKTNPEIQQIQWRGAPMGVHLKYGAKPFNDIRVRKALQMAMDLPTIAKTHWGGTVEGEPVSLGSTLIGEDWVVPYEQWPAKLKAEYSYDVKGAKALMAEAAADGVFKPNKLGGFDTNVIASITDDLELLQIIQSYFREIGVDMEINDMDKVQHANLVFSHTYDQMVYATVGGVVTSPSDTIQKFLPDCNQNGGGVDDQHYNSLVKKFNSAATLDEAQRLYKETERYALEQHWVVSMCPITQTVAYQPWVKGYCGEFLWTVWSVRYFQHMWRDQNIK